MRVLQLILCRGSNDERQSEAMDIAYVRMKGTIRSRVLTLL